IMSVRCLSCVRGNAALHSFPTRRSSDLFNQAQKFGAEIMIPVTVKSLDCTRKDGAFSVALDGCDPLHSRAVVVASGARYRRPEIDRKSTRLNSSHDQISYAVFCLKKKTY